MENAEKYRRHPPTWLRALGGEDLPSAITVSGITYQHIRTFKHDFFAATGLYEGSPGKVVLKIGRRVPIFGIPLQWIGVFLKKHESRLYGLTESIKGVPALTGEWGATGMAHTYVEGRPLARHDIPDDQFFPALSAMLDAIHARGAAYVDLEKRENILLGDDGRPYLIDFQISWHLPRNRGGATWPARLLLEALQASDRYHLMKHWRRHRPDQLEAGDIAASYQTPFWIRWHRAVFRPVTKLRRRILVGLGARSSPTGRSPG